MITYWRLVGRNKWVNLQLGALAAIASSPCSCSFIWLEGSAKEFELIILFLFTELERSVRGIDLILCPIGLVCELSIHWDQGQISMPFWLKIWPTLIDHFFWSHPSATLCWIRGNFRFALQGSVIWFCLRMFISFREADLFHLWSWFISVISIELIQLSDWCEQIPLGTWSLVDLISFIWSDQQTEQSAAFFNRSD